MDRHGNGPHVSNDKKCSSTTKVRNLTDASSSSSSSLSSPLTQTVPMARMEGHEGPIHVVKFTKDGKYCFSAGWDRTVRLWNPHRPDPASCHNEDGQDGANGANGHGYDCLPIQSYRNGHGNAVDDVAVDDSHRVLLSNSDRTLVVTDVVTSAVRSRRYGHTGRIHAVAFVSSSSSEENIYASASYDRSLRLWDGRSPQCVQTLDDASDSLTAVWGWADRSTNSSGSNSGSTGSSNSGSGWTIGTASVDGCLRLYDIRKGRLTVDDTGVALTHAAVSAHATEGIVANGLDGTLRYLVDGELLSWMGGSHLAGRYGLRCDMRLVDKDEPNHCRRRRNNNNSNNNHCNNDQKKDHKETLYAVTGSEDGAVVIYDVMSRTHVATLREPHIHKTHETSHSHGHKPVCAVAAGPNGWILSGGYDGRGLVWKLNDHDHDHDNPT